jgi:hypothetical protein
VRSPFRERSEGVLSGERSAGVLSGERSAGVHLERGVYESFLESGVKIFESNGVATFNAPVHTHSTLPKR